MSGHFGTLPDRSRIRLDKLREVVQSRYDHALNAQRGLRDDLGRFMQLYMGINQDVISPWESNLVAPAVFDAVETHLPHIITEDFEFRVVPGAGADPAKTQAFDRLLAYDTDRTDLAWQMVPFAKQGLIYGTSPMFVGYSFQEEMLAVREFEQVFAGTPAATMLPTTGERRVVTFDGPFVETTDLVNTFPEPGKKVVNAPGGRGMNWLLHRFRVPYSYLLQLEQQGVLVPGVLKDLQGKGEPISPSEINEEFERAQLMGIDIGLEDHTVQHVEIIAMWGDRLHDMRGLVWLANREVIIRDEAHPFFHGKIPFCFFQDIPQIHDIFGLGQAHILESYQYEKSDLRNSRLDNVHMIQNRMWLRKAGSMVDPNQLQSAPGNVIDVEAMDDVRPLDHQDIPQSSYRDEQLLQDDMDRTSGSLDVLRGRQLGGNRSSATENQLMAELASTRSLIKRMGLRRCLREVGRMMLQLEQQFLTQEKLVRVAGPDGATVETRILPEDIIGQWDVKVELDQKLPLTRIQRRQEEAELWDRISPLFGTFLDPMPYVDALVRAYGRDPSSRIKPIQQDPSQGGQDGAGAATPPQIDPAQIAQEAIAAAGG